MKNVTSKLKEDVVRFSIDHLGGYVKNDLFIETMRTLTTKRRLVLQVNAHIRNDLIDWDLFE